MTTTDGGQGRKVPLPINSAFRADIARLVRARTPLIAVLTHEEQALIRTLRASTRDREVFVWSCTRGLMRIEPDGAVTDANPQMTKPSLLFQDVLNRPGDPGAFYILLDIHPWLAEVATVRYLRDIAAAIADRKITVFFSSPIFPIPPELEKTVQLLSMPLPNAEILERILQAAAEEARLNNIPVTLPSADARALVEALGGLTEPEAEQALAEGVVAHRALSIAIRPTLLKAKAATIRKAGFEYREPIAMDQVGGVPAVKEYARELQASMTPEARAYGVRAQRAALLAGPPGTGKTLITAALSGGSRPVLRGSFAAMYTSELGGTEANVRRFLAIAEATGALVQLDEIEKAFGGDGGERDGGTTGRAFEMLLTWLEETAGDSVFASFTANHPEKLPPEFLSRMSAIFWMGLPTTAARREIWAIQLRQVGRQPANFDLDALAAQSKGYVGREIRNAVDAAVMKAFVRGQPDVTTSARGKEERGKSRADSFRFALATLRQLGGLIRLRRRRETTISRIRRASMARRAQPIFDPGRDADTIEKFQWTDPATNKNREYKVETWTLTAAERSQPELDAGQDRPHALLGRAGQADQQRADRLPRRAGDHPLPRALPLIQIGGLIRLRG
jgi:SpoVK/Ycf46/Vps4 family AAA+-type ATPase